MTQPLVRRLAEQGQVVSVAALTHIAPIYRAMPLVTNVLALPFSHGRLDLAARHTLAQQLNGHFDAAYVLPNSIKSALIPWLARIPKRVGYVGESRVGLLTHRMANPPKHSRPAMVPFYSALSGDPDVSGDRPELVVAPEQVALFCGPRHLQPGHYVVLAPGSEFGSAKRWPATHYAAVARELMAGNAPGGAIGIPNGCQVVLLGSVKETALCADIERAAPGLLNCAGQTSLHEAMACIAGARAVLSNDSGLMHVAAALHVSQVAVFGSSSPEHTPPLSDRAHVLWLKSDPAYSPALDCAPCYARECRFGHTRCLVDLAPQTALALLA